MMNFDYSTDNFELEENQKEQSNLLNHTEFPPYYNTTSIPWRRPFSWNRKFRSLVIDDTINKIRQKMKDNNLAVLFENCWPDALDRGILWSNSKDGSPRTFIVSDDLNIMFIRDSAYQAISYAPYAKSDDKLRQMLLGVILLQAEYIAQDPYANSFYPPPESSLSRPNNPWNADITTPARSEITWQLKYSADTFASFLKLTYHYWLNTNDTKFCHDSYWKKAIEVIMVTLRQQQYGSLEELKFETYRFTRETRNPAETLALNGQGSPAREIGLIKSAFRPSDDATTYPYVIPINAMLSVELEHLAKIIEDLDPVISQDALLLSRQIKKAIFEHGVHTHPVFGKIFAYEVDGYGSFHFMDDAMIPNLISLPYLGFVNHSDPIYNATRQFALSEWNKWYFDGTAGKGIGSEHLGLGYIWPVSFASNLLTSKNDSEILEQLEMVKNIALETGRLEQAFWYQDKANITRRWFGPANALFGEAILKIADESPWILFDVPPPTVPPPTVPPPTYLSSSFIPGVLVFLAVGFMLFAIISKQNIKGYEGIN